MAIKLAAMPDYRDLGATDFGRRWIKTAIGPIEVGSWGPEAAAATILVHHGMGSLESLAELGHHLSLAMHSRRIIIWSRPGCGHSPTWPEREQSDPLNGEAALVLPALMDALVIGKADFVGHGDGATLSLLFAALHPERTGCVVALSPVAYVDPIFHSATNEMPTDEASSGLSRRLMASHASPQATYERWLSCRRRQIQANWSALRVMAGVTAPVLLIQGQDDEFASESQIGALAEALSGPVDWFLLRNQGHFLPYERPEQVFSMIDSFLDRQRRGTQARNGQRQVLDRSAPILRESRLAMSTISLA